MPAERSDHAPDAAARERIARQLLALTREMVELGQAGDWPAFAARERERQQLSSELFASPVPREAATVVADCIRRVLDLDQELFALTEAHRDEASRALKDMQRGQKAANAYRRFSR
ncbi:flagellar protein FliT [Sediminicurvatus halobius]|uniref:flagellar protein FliT n=1 Tax=Sediminicurvatus halobius TaxID=2182432 RepID=UPI001E391739|nr:flagellar protein FliT [Spiribacter halobius]UEX79781.1 flagellar protein FliT [Spiribacter halobius]